MDISQGDKPRTTIAHDNKPVFVGITSVIVMNSVVNVLQNKISPSLSVLEYTRAAFQTKAVNSTISALDGLLQVPNKMSDYVASLSNLIIWTSMNIEQNLFQKTDPQTNRLK